MAMYIKSVARAACALLVMAVLVSGDSSPNEYELPSNSSVVNFGPIVTGFSCDGLQYGYYADVANGCRIFHVCYPYMDAEGFIRTRMWSFICGLGTVFNQQALVCDFPENTTPCDQAPNFYNVNEYFGREDVNFLE
ncbi:U-scoloptoxin(01)-Cw1a [Hyalella azteca]|uniref:U-scoloptoxin(01)-Cw1a n=1 Tax=Hyalella azteca TaxID=294128 RepID=A0A8B7NBD6_HYAAZ|nr:U-scoloptoxin(01)-Cw1a [Hyalella azteca]